MLFRLPHVKAPDCVLSRPFRVAEAVQMVGRVGRMPVVKIEVVKHGAPRKSRLVRPQMEAAVYPDAQFRHVPAVVERGNVAVLPVTAHLPDFPILRQAVQNARRFRGKLGKSLLFHVVLS